MHFLIVNWLFPIDCNPSTQKYIFMVALVWYSGWYQQNIWSEIAENAISTENAS